jgi:hypothetical protein
MPATVATPEGLRKFLDMQAEAGWRFIATVGGKMLVFARDDDVKVSARKASLVDE